MSPAGQIGSHALSLNQSTTSSFVFLVFVFVFVSQTIHHHPLCFVFALVSCPVSQLMHQSTTSDFVFLVFVFVSIPVSRIPINPPTAALFTSVFGFQYLPVSQSSTNIYHRCQGKKEFEWSWHYEFQSANQGTGLTKLRRDFFYFSHKQARSFR